MNCSKIQAPTEIFATKGDEPGNINLQWDSVVGATSYVVQKSAKNCKRIWKHVDIVTESSCKLEDLTKNKTYLFRVAAVNKLGQSNWSKEIEKKT